MRINIQLMHANMPKCVTPDMFSIVMIMHKSLWLIIIMILFPTSERHPMACIHSIYGRLPLFVCLYGAVLTQLQINNRMTVSIWVWKLYKG